MSQGEIVTAVGRQQAAIAKKIGLLGLPASVQEMISRSDLSTSHEKLSYGSYERLDRAHAELYCSKDGPCRAVGLERDGHLVQICTDSKDYRKRQMAAVRDETKGRKEEAKKRATQLDAILDSAPAYDRVGLAAVVADRIWQFKKVVGKRVITRFAGVLDPKVMDDYDGRRDTHKALARLPIENLLQILVHGKMLDDMADHLAYGGLTGSRAWYMEQVGKDSFLGASLTELKSQLSAVRAKLDDGRLMGEGMVLPLRSLSRQTRFPASCRPSLPPQWL